MPATLDLANFYKAIPNRETVTFIDLQGNTFTVTDAKRLQQDVRERAPSLGRYIGDRADWRLPRSTGLNSADPPIPGCFIKDSTNLVFSVLAVDTALYNGCYKCQTITLNVYGDTVQWFPVDQQTNRFGDRITNLAQQISQPPAATFTSAWIQPIDADEEDILGKRGLTQRFYVYLLTELDLTKGDVFQDQDGFVYEIEHWESKKNLDSAFTVLCRIQP